MRAVVQRVVSAAVSGVETSGLWPEMQEPEGSPIKLTFSVGDEVVGKIGPGICVLIGLGRDDQASDLQYIARKLTNLRIFESAEEKKWDKSVRDLELEILCISQFTLYAVIKGNKPDFHQAMGPDEAPAFYQQFMEHLRASYKEELVKDGRFGAYMRVDIQNDGPVTITLDSRNK